MEYRRGMSITEEKARALGFVENEGYMYAITDNNATIIIDEEAKDVVLNPKLSKLTGTIRVMGGSGLQTAEEMFKGFRCNRLCLNKFEIRYADSYKSMFEDCINLKQIDISNFESKFVCSTESMFANCRNLEEVKLCGFSRNLDDIRAMFCGCRLLKEIDLTNMEIANVEDMSKLFEGCKSLELIKKPEGYAESVENMYRMFYNCRKLRNVDFNRICVVRVWSTCEMFYNCMSLEDIDFSVCEIDIDEQNKKDFDQLSEADRMFAGCSGLKQIDLSCMNISPLETNIGMFAGCSNLSKVETTCSLVLEEFEYMKQGK